MTILLISFIILLIIIIGVVLYYIFSSESYKKSNKKTIPKIIWTYWEGNTMPQTVKECIANVKRLNNNRDSKRLHKNWQVNVITNKNLNKYIPNSELPNLYYKVNIQKRSDFVRLYLLNKFGGVWIDASVILCQNLNWVLKKQQKDNSEMVVFYMPMFTKNKEYPVIESWFIASVKGSKFIREWYHKFKNVLNGNAVSDIKRYVSDVKATTDLQGMSNLSWLDYLLIHVIAQEILQGSNTDFKISYYNAFDHAFKYNKKFNWNVNKIMEYLSGNMDSKLPYFIKLRSTERPHVDKYRPFKKGSVFEKFLKSD